METNINCDLGETSIHTSTDNDPTLLTIVNTANVACGFHAGDESTMIRTMQISKKNNVSIGAHPSFNDRENFGRKRIKLSSKEINKLILDQLEIISSIADKQQCKISHVKPHGALNNMACEDYNLSYDIGTAIKQFNKDLIYMCGAKSEMEKAGNDLNMKVACEIFADRNYDDYGRLISRDLPHALITNPQESLEHIVTMLTEQSIRCYSGKKISCQIDTICLHSDGVTAVPLAKKLKEGLLAEGFELKPLNTFKKFL
jgi:5-oxoprolinase (ATP-hydrolysing) subunit A